MTPRRDPAASPASNTPATIEQALLGALALGAVAMVCFPAARSAGDTVGWLPLWLVALPASAWVTARALRLREIARQTRRPLASVHALADVRGKRARTAPSLHRAA